MRYGYNGVYQYGNVSPTYVRNFLTSQSFTYFYCARSLTIPNNPRFLMVEYNSANISYPEPYTTYFCLPGMNYRAFKCTPSANTLASSSTEVDVEVHNYFGNNISKTISIWMACIPTRCGYPTWWPY